jgi:hypothetical protein
MRRVVRAIVDGLPLDARSRRVMDEALLDWTHEAASSSSIGARVCVDVRSVVSIVRALVLVSVRETTAIPIAWLAGRVVLFGLLPALVFVMAAPGRLPRLLAELPALQGAEVTLAIAIETLVVTLPLALFYTVAWRPATRSLPTVGMAFAGSGLVVVYLAGILPLATWRVAELEHLRLSLAGAFGLDQWLDRVLIFLSFGCVTFALVILAEAVFRTRRRRRIPILFSATPLYFAALFGTAVLQSFLIAMLARRGWYTRRYLFVISPIPTASVVIVIASLWWARRLAATPRPSDGSAADSTPA